MSSGRALVVTADDVGLHPGMTAGALAAHDGGLVTACSLSACGAAFGEAVAALACRPGLDVGVHLTLVEERPLSPAGEVPTLVDGNGRFLPGFPAFVARYALGAIACDEVEREWRRQIARVFDAGLAPLHLNSHQHLHTLPRLFALTVRLAREHGIPFVRIPGDPAAFRSLRPRALAVRALDRLGRRARRRLDSAEPPAVRAVDRTVGVLVAGQLDEPALLSVLEDVEGTAELVCHPGRGDADLAHAYDWGYRWDAETAALRSPRAAAALAARGIELTRFSRLAPLSGSPVPRPPTATDAPRR